MREPFKFSEPAAWRPALNGTYDLRMREGHETGTLPDGVIRSAEDEAA